MRTRPRARTLVVVRLPRAVVPVPKWVPPPLKHFEPEVAGFGRAGGEGVWFGQDAWGDVSEGWRVKRVAHTDRPIACGIGEFGQPRGLLVLNIV